MKIFLQDIQGTTGILYTAYIYAKSSEASGSIKIFNNNYYDIRNVPNINSYDRNSFYLEIL